MMMITWRIIFFFLLSAVLTKYHFLSGYQCLNVRVRVVVGFISRFAPTELHGNKAMDFTLREIEKKPLICVPGQRLCLIDKDHICGNGTYEHQGYIHASIAGSVELKNSGESSTKIIEVRGINEQSVVPAPGDIVTAKVMVLTQRFCKCLIKCIGDTVLSRPYRAILRKEDIRATDKDHIDMYKCFRPGDIILARVLPLTEIHSYHLSTAENELGVVIAHSEAGVPMIPISWTEMQCPKTHNKELRKVARIVPEEITVDE